jgi:type II secretory pathway pseudopilin PulG
MKQSKEIQEKKSKNRKGFTIIEILLFFAISGLLIVGLLIGTTSSIARQRYNDSVQDLADFLKTQYYAVSNPTIPEWDGADLFDYPSPETNCNFINTIRGRSRCQLLGRLITIGEDENDPGVVNTYLVVGQESQAAKNTPYFVRIGSARPFIPATNLSDSYSVQWGAVPENIEKGSTLKASILIVRPPYSGTVQTYVTAQSADAVLPVRDFYDSFVSGEDPNALFSGYEDLGDMFSASNSKAFSETDSLDICVGSNDILVGSNRRDIRIKAGGTNASAVEIIAEGSEDNKCIN